MDRCPYRNIIKTLLSASKFERGLVENDYPYIQKISPNVYTDHALIGSPDDRYTTKTMFVVRDGGVMPDSAKDDYLDLHLGGRGIHSVFRGHVHNVGDYFIAFIEQTLADESPHSRHIWS